MILIAVFIGAMGCVGNANEDKGGRVEVAELYNKNCAICHGKDGRKGLAGAKLLPESKLDLAARIEIITNGKGTMAPYKNVLSKAQIKEIAEYTFELE